MKRIIPILIVLLLVGTCLISGCVTPASDTGEVSQFEDQLGVGDINNDLNILDADAEDFDISDLDDVASDLNDL